MSLPEVTTPEPLATVACLGCGVEHHTATGRYDHLISFRLNLRHGFGPTIIDGWVCDRPACLSSAMRRASRARREMLDRHPRLGSS